MIPFTTTAAQKVRVAQIACLMKDAELHDEFLANLIDFASEFEGAYNLMELWVAEQNQEDKEAIIADLQEEIEDWLAAPKKPTRKPYIKFDDLEVIAQDVVGFKQHLKTLVDQWGGISKLARVTGIPQPSLSRFFNSANMPRRTTIYKIAIALGLSEKEIITDWAA